jgi:glycosyltransferase involved in cell wall biosynthesis
MRILFALNTSRPHIDGVGISLERQAAGLEARGHDVGIIAPSPRFASYVETLGDRRIYRVRTLAFDGHHLRLPVFPGPGVVDALRDFQADVVVVSLPFLLSRATWGAARRLGYPVVGITSVMPEWFYYNVPGLSRLARRLDGVIWRYISDYYNRCDHVVGVSDTAINLLRRHGLRRSSSVVSNGVPIDVFQPRRRDVGLARRLGIAPNKPVVLYAGRLEAEKCVDVLIRAIPHVLEKVDAHFVVGGDGKNRRSLEQLVSRLHVAEAVSFVGFLDDDDYPRIYSLADIFAIASPAELQSVVTLEAASSGLPLVGANAGALPELIADGVNGILFEPGSSAELADALAQLLKCPGRRVSMGAESRAIAMHHDLNRSLDKLERIYEGVLRRRTQLRRAVRGTHAVSST